MLSLYLDAAAAVVTPTPAIMYPALLVRLLMIVFSPSTLGYLNRFPLNWTDFSSGKLHVA